MESQFWIKAWNEGRTNFHQQDYNANLLQYFPQLTPQEGQRVLVPLCGKSKDLLWLHGLKLHVHGIELHEQAVESFFTESKLAPLKKTQDRGFINYAFGDIVISCGDFFKLEESASYDFVYDRAALVALPAPMRKPYAQKIKDSLKKGGKCLLIAYEYDQTEMDGPPFSVGSTEIHELYQDQFSIKLLASSRPSTEGSRFTSLSVLTENVYVLEKNL